MIIAIPFSLSLVCISFFFFLFLVLLDINNDELYQKQKT